MDIRFETADYNSAPALVIYHGEQLEGVFVFEVIDDKITNLYAMRNPDKLAGVTIPAGDQPIVTSATSGAKLSHSECPRCLEDRPAQRRSDG